MKVGDLVELKKSVLNAGSYEREKLEAPQKKWIGVVVSKDLNATKVHWFGSGSNQEKPSTCQYVLKLKVVSEI